MTVLHFDGTSSVLGSVPGTIPLLCLKTPRKDQHSLVQVYHLVMSLIK